MSCAKLPGLQEAAGCTVVALNAPRGHMQPATPAPAPVPAPPALPGPSPHELRPHLARQDGKVQGAWSCRRSFSGAWRPGAAWMRHAEWVGKRSGRRARHDGSASTGCHLTAPPLPNPILRTWRNNTLACYNSVWVPCFGVTRSPGHVPSRAGPQPAGLVGGCSSAAPLSPGTPTVQGAQAHRPAAGRGRRAQEQARTYASRTRSAEARAHRPAHSLRHTPAATHRSVAEPRLPCCSGQDAVASKAVCGPEVPRPEGPA